MKRIINIVIVLAVIAGMVFLLKMNKKANEQKTELAGSVSTAVPVRIDVVKEELFKVGFSSNGTTEPVQELAFVSDVSGRVTRILVEKGARVSKGQTLVLVDDELLKADFAANEAAYNALKTDYERFKNASEKGGVTAQQADNIRNQLVAAESRYLVSKRRLADATIKSPLAGTINEKYIQIGAFLNPGARLFDIVDESKLKLRCMVSEQQVLKLKTGQKVALTCSALSGESFSGTLSFIGAKADRGLSFPLEIILDEKKSLKAGMYLTALFDSDTETKGLLIPRNAVSGSVKSASVFVVNQGMAQRRDILVGAILGKKVEVSEGLQAGDSIVVSGLINVADGARVVQQ